MSVAKERGDTTENLSEMKGTIKPNNETKKSDRVFWNCALCVQYSAVLYCNLCVMQCVCCCVHLFSYILFIYLFFCCYLHMHAR